MDSSKNNNQPQYHIYNYLTVSMCLLPKVVYHKKHTTNTELLHQLVVVISKLINNSLLDYQFVVLFLFSENAFTGLCCSFLCPCRKHIDQTNSTTIFSINLQQHEYVQTERFHIKVLNDLLILRIVSLLVDKMFL